MIYFTNFFDIDEKIIEFYGAFNISLINDLPLFIDPFLLFGSEKEEYQNLHQEILKYMSFLKSKSKGISDAQIEAWYMFPEVKQNWFGYSAIGNGGSGLGIKLGRSLCANFDLKIYSKTIALSRFALNRRLSEIFNPFLKIRYCEAQSNSDCLFSMQ